MKLIEVGRDELDSSLVRVEVEMELDGPRILGGPPGKLVRRVFIEDAPRWREVETGTLLDRHLAEELGRLLWLRERERLKAAREQLDRDRAAAQNMLRQMDAERAARRGEEPA